MAKNEVGSSNVKAFSAMVKNFFWNVPSWNSVLKKNWMKRSLWAKFTGRKEKDTSHLENTLMIPKDLRKDMIRVSALDFFVNGCLGTVFANMLKYAGNLLENNFISFGILIYIVYLGRNVILNATQIALREKSTKVDEMENAALAAIGCQIVGKVYGRVYTNDKRTGIFGLVSNESLFNSLKNSIKGVWKIETRHFVDIAYFLWAIAVLINAVITNDQIPHTYFVTILILSCLVSSLVMAYVSRKRKAMLVKQRNFRDDEAVIVNDLVRIPYVVPKKDIRFRIDIFRGIIQGRKESVVEYNKHFSLGNTLNALCDYVIDIVLIVLFITTGQKAITIGTITEIGGMLAIVSNAKSCIKKVVSIMEEHNDTVMQIEAEQEILTETIRAYEECVEYEMKDDEVDSIMVPRFDIKYVESSENDIPFRLLMDKEVLISRGDVVVLHGESGCGKSTFQKILTRRLKLGSDADMPATTRFLYYDETLRFGSRCIFEEFFCNENPELVKAEEILRNLHLWEEIQKNCNNVWRWMKEKNFMNSLSNGQKQRMLLAKMLYWLDDDIDIVTLDECTSGLDEKSDGDGANATEIMRYVLHMLNRDKKRIVVIATHQNFIDDIREDFPEHKFIDLYFRKKEGEASYLVKTE